MNNKKILAKTLKIDTLEHGALFNSGVKFMIQFWIEIFIFILVAKSKKKRRSQYAKEQG